MLVADTGREAPADGVRFYRAAGWDEAALEHYKARFGGFGKAVHALPDSYRRVVDGEELTIGAHRWRAVIGRGHSPEHLCLYGPQLQAADLRRPGAAAHQLQRLGVPHRAGRRSAARLARVARGDRRTGQ